MSAEYNGTTDKADAGYSTGVEDLNIFYEVSQRTGRAIQRFMNTLANVTYLSRLDI